MAPDNTVTTENEWWLVDPLSGKEIRVVNAPDELYSLYLQEGWSENFREKLRAFLKGPLQDGD